MEKASKYRGAGPASARGRARLRLFDPRYCRSRPTNGPPAGDQVDGKLLDQIGKKYGLAPDVKEHHLGRDKVALHHDLIDLPGGRTCRIGPLWITTRRTLFEHIESASPRMSGHGADVLGLQLRANNRHARFHFAKAACRTPVESFDLVEQRLVIVHLGRVR